MIQSKIKMGTVKVKEICVTVHQRSISQSCQGFEGNSIYWFSITAAESAQGLMIKHIDLFLSQACSPPLASN